MVDATPVALHLRRVSKQSPGEIGQRKAAWHDLVVLCRKCGGKRPGGFGADGEDDLRAALRRELRETGHKRRVRVVETGCLGVCPKRAVVAFRATDPGRLLIVPRGQPLVDVVAALGLTAPG